MEQPPPATSQEEINDNPEDQGENAETALERKTQVAAHQDAADGQSDGQSHGNHHHHLEAIRRRGHSGMDLTRVFIQRAVIGFIENVIRRAWKTLSVDTRE